MAYKVTVTNVEQNIEQITITYNILNSSDQIVSGSQSVVISDPNNYTKSKVKADLFRLAKAMEQAEAINTEWQPLIGQTLTVD